MFAPVSPWPWLWLSWLWRAPILTDKDSHRQESSQTWILTDWILTDRNPHRLGSSQTGLTAGLTDTCSQPAPPHCLLPSPSLTRIFQCLANRPPAQTCGLSSYTSLSETGLYTSLSKTGLYNSLSKTGLYTSLTPGLTPYTVYTWGYTGLFLHLKYSCTTVLQ